MNHNTYFNANLETMAQLATLCGDKQKEISRGVQFALHMYARTKSAGCERFTILGMTMPRGGDLEAMIRVVVNAGIRMIVLADESSGLMEGLHILMNEGFKVSDTVTIDHDNYTEHGLLLTLD